MQDRESQGEANPGRVERGLDAAATQGSENGENPELRGGPVNEREDGGQIAPRQRQAPREDPAPGGGLS